ncbi:ABC-2 type transporter [Dillenia turbinata]|uniref:ABC-2 type transporter n=1 Tax=Dillenia turbinata TaxID=194707 RepID=A0AAN8Z759_9MAGN
MASALAGDDLVRTLSNRSLSSRRSIRSASTRSWASASIREAWASTNDVFQKSSSKDDEEELKWAAIEKLPTYDRLRKGLLKQILEDGGVQYEEVDIANLGLHDKRHLMDNILKVVEDDNEKFLHRLRDRTDRVGIEIPQIEIRFSHLSVEGDAYVGTRALPTLLNSTLNAVEGLLGLLRIFPSKKRVVNILLDVSGIVKPSRMTLLLGPPGAGKTTLLQSLAGKRDKDLRVATYIVMLKTFRFFRQLLAFVGVHQMALSLFRFIAALGRTQVVANTLGTFTLLLVFVLGGFIVAKDDIKPWMIWGYYISPMMYGQNAIVINEFLDVRWSKPNLDPRCAEPSIGKALLKARGMFVEGYWYWICIGALIGFSLFFNLCFVAALTYLNPLGDSNAFIQLEDNNSKSKKLSSSIGQHKTMPIEKSSESTVPQPEGIDMAVMYSPGILNIGAAGQAPVKTGMVLPFPPLSLAFDHVNYYVDMPAVNKTFLFTRRNQALIKELSNPAPGTKDLFFATEYSQSFVTQCKACFWKQYWSYWRNPKYNAIRFFMTIAIGLLFGVIFLGKGDKTKSRFGGDGITGLHQLHGPSTIGDIDDPVEVPGRGSTPVKQYLKDNLGFDYNFLGAVVAAHVGWVLLFLFVFAYGIKFLNFQRR